MEDMLKQLIPSEPKRLIIKNFETNTPRELELQKLRLKYINDTQTDPRLHGEKTWVAYYVHLIEISSEDLPYYEKPCPSSWAFHITDTDRELFPIEFSNAKSVKITFDEDLEVFYGDLYI